MKRCVFLLSAFLSLAGCSANAGSAATVLSDSATNAATKQAEAPRYDFKLQKAEDSISIKTDERRTVFVVGSASGIGSATVTLLSGRWPKHVTLRFEYLKGRGFDVIEGFRITTERLQFEDAARPGQKTMPFRLLDGEGKAGNNETSAGELNVLVERHQDALEINLPANLFVGSKEVKIGWIDFYR